MNVESEYSKRQIVQADFTSMGTPIFTLKRNLRFRFWIFSKLGGYNYIKIIIIVNNITLAKFYNFFFNFYSFVNTRLKYIVSIYFCKNDL